MQQIIVKGELKKRPSWVKNKNCANTSICWLHLVIMSILPLLLSAGFIWLSCQYCLYFYLLASFGYHVNTAFTSICWLHLVIMSILPLLLSAGFIWLSCQYCLYFYLLASFGYHVNTAFTSICWLHLVIMSILIDNRKKMNTSMGQYFY